MQFPREAVRRLSPSPTILYPSAGSWLCRRRPRLSFSSSLEVIALDAKLYEVLSLAMRYFFTFIGLLIVWRSLSWLAKDRGKRHRRLKNLPDAGTIGILTVEAGDRELAPGDTLPVPYEGVLGYLRTCDVVVPVDEVANLHLDFSFVNGKGLFIHPRRGCAVTVDGYPIENARDSREHPMIHGSVLEVGQAVLRLGVFAGLDVPAVPVIAPYPAAGDAPEDWSPEAPDMPPAPNGYPPQSPWPPYAAPGQTTPPGPPSSQQPYPPYAPWPPQGTPDPTWQGGDRHAP